MNRTIHVAQGHKTRGIASFFLAAFSLTWPSSGGSWCPHTLIV
jgi:hypothetical protein